LAYPGRQPEVKQQIVEMTLNGSGVGDILRVLRVSFATVLKELTLFHHFRQRKSKKRPVFYYQAHNQ
jgi:transposase-like protein